MGCSVSMSGQNFAPVGYPLADYWVAGFSEIFGNVANTLTECRTFTNIAFPYRAKLQTHSLKFMTSRPNR